MARKTGVLAAPLAGNIPRGTETEAFAHDVIAGLSAMPKRIPPKYFYDSEGSNLFEEITRTPEYYPTRSEHAILRMQASLNNVYGKDELMHYIVSLAEESRQHPDVLLGASPRAALCLLKCARARAVLEGRHFFTHEDVQEIALGVLGHRLIVRPEAEVEGRHVSDVVKDVLESVPVLEST